MNGSYILDSNIVINVFRNDSKTIERVTQLRNIYIPVIVLGELYYGANKSNQTPKRTLEIEQLKSRVNLLEVTEKTAEKYGEIKDQIRQKGNPSPKTIF
jgi:tRNA(fMet)-specific endonuclease VapC